MKLWHIFLASLVLQTSPTQAINVGAITEIMPPDSQRLGKEISNTVDDARLVTLSVERITSPLEGGKVIPFSTPGEVMVSPANLLLPGSAKDIFRIVYGGPSDGVERYYRLVWRDNPVTEEGTSKSRKTASATTSATISTVLVIAPRKETFTWRYDKAQGVIYNAGNATFRVVAAGPCRTGTSESNKDGCRERYYVMPGLGVHLKYVDITQRKTSVGIWHNQTYITIK